MKKQTLIIALSTLTLLLASVQIGCVGVMAPAWNIGIAAIPIPISPYFQQGYEDLHWEDLRYNKVAIMGPVCNGGNATALDSPPDDQVIRALEKIRPVSGSVPFLETTYRTNIRITKELMADYLDPPAVVPMVGPAQVHHSHWKCTVYFREVINVGWPIPHQLVDEEAQEVIYIDMDHLHRVAGPDGE